ncbi:MAG TPA: xanthine dehydrogenase family protein molybdopterin-binding subunit [Bacillota bacterium]|nr:xanthine dehydrogenase family protein molybdopterin-binding subunit [Bacillota bacterium]
MGAIGESIPKKEAWDKVTGSAKYNDDSFVPGMLYAKIVTSSFAHAWIKSIDVSQAISVPGVRAVLTGQDISGLCGTVLEDRPPLAREKVRYFGEPVVLVIAGSEAEAMRAAGYVKIVYEPLPIINSTVEAMAKDAPLIHPKLAQYKRLVQDVYPEPGSNVCNRISIIKGNLLEGWSESDVVIQGNYVLPQSGHIAMEPRNAKAEILPSGEVIIYTSTQAPFEIRSSISRYANMDEARVVVRVPLVGGGFGGKDTVQLEFLAYLASRAVNGRLVRVAEAREEDIASSPCREGLRATVRLGCSKDGKFKALAITYYVDTGAYADLGPRLAKAMAVDCTGPYNIENIECEALCVYTNHTYVTAFRGFGHVSYNFCIERSIDKMAHALRVDPLELRMKNTILPGNFSPTRVEITKSNTGDLQQCLVKLKKLMNWNEGIRQERGGKVIARGVSCLWKTSNSPIYASAEAILTLNRDGSINLNNGAVEIGPGQKTTLAQILAEKLGMNIERIHVVMGVDTQVSPYHWKTVASMTTFLVGNAVLAAADDLVARLKIEASQAMGCSSEELEVADERVYKRNEPGTAIYFRDFASQFLPDEKGIEQPISGSGSFTMPNLTPVDPLTGAGRPGPYWTVGAQAVEVEYNPEDFTYRLRKAATVLDAGKLINPRAAEGQIKGGMCMGLGLGTREYFHYSGKGEILNNSLRKYKVMVYGEMPEYLVQFVETPEPEAPYGARGLGEHGIIGIPAALANALSTAAQVELDFLPLTPEVIWRTTRGKVW